MQISPGSPIIRAGCYLQRLFSTFPDGWAGSGLLLLRLGSGIALICFGTDNFSTPTKEPIAIGRDLAAAVGGIFLLAGLWTPLMGTLLALNEAWAAFSLSLSQPDRRWIHLLLAVLTGGLAMLGPGAWSVDARLFGRKRFDIGKR
jgi:putative oxidoreductase